MGLGTGARIPASPRMGVIEGRTGMAAASGRQSFQADVAARFQIVRVFAMESGIAVTRVQQAGADGDQVNLPGGFPYLRPRLQFGHASLAVALAALGALGVDQALVLVET